MSAASCRLRPTAHRTAPRVVLGLVVLAFCQRALADRVDCDQLVLHATPRAAYDHGIRIWLDGVPADVHSLRFIEGPVFARVKWEPGASETAFPLTRRERKDNWRADPRNRSLVRPGRMEGFSIVELPNGTRIIPAGTYRYRIAILPRKRSLKEACVLWSNPFVIENDSPVVRLQ